MRDVLMCTVFGYLTVCLVSGCSVEERMEGGLMFSAMGDVPYSPKEDEMLRGHVAGLDMRSAFVVHVGDIKAGKMECDEAVYVKVSGMLAKSRLPVFIIPGDNEYNDCKRPDEAWGYWVKYFMHFDKKWAHEFEVLRHVRRPENFAFVREGVLFMGIHIVGGRIHDKVEWKRRHWEDLVWVNHLMDRFGGEVERVVVFGHCLPKKMHDDFFVPFAKRMGAWGKPVLYLHGDGHRWIYDRPFKGAKNVLRVQVDAGGKGPPVKVRVRMGGGEAFEFDRGPLGKVPRKKPAKKGGGAKKGKKQ